jgi:L-amino acid N-acyltransferase YncA
MQTDAIELRDARSSDAAAMAAIYNHYVLGTTVSMEFDPVEPVDIERRMDAVREARLPWLVLLERGAVAGYAYATPWRTRPGYRHAVESTVYLDARARGRGHGRRLYAALLARLAGRAHCVIGGIALPNPASVGLHEALGFRQVARFSEVGCKFGDWVDVGYWQLLLPQPSSPD